jgi:hypothetical protein
VGPVAADSIDVRHVRYMRARPNYVGMGLYRIVPDVLEPMWMFRQREIYNPAGPVSLEAPMMATDSGSIKGFISFINNPKGSLFKNGGHNLLNALLHLDIVG